MSSLDGRRFSASADVVGGEITTETVFEYMESDGVVSARYSGGSGRLGFLVGTRDGDTLDFRCSQLNTDGETSNGHCRSAVGTRPDGRLHLDEAWQWESRQGSGTSAVDELL
ncbi:MAG: hypothetical protein JWM93_3455 [Frankiales bacterium]|nr:hypothetical protein [Frankiales bacterium]